MHVSESLPVSLPHSPGPKIELHTGVFLKLGQLLFVGIFGIEKYWIINGFISSDIHWSYVIFLFLNFGSIVKIRREFCTHRQNMCRRQ